MKLLVSAIAAILICSPVYGTAAPEPLPAFPGAEGWGADTPGGRGGRVIKVTNLNTSGPGSLQEACAADGARIVVFDTSGVIPGPVAIEHGRITIMGQTAPGAGITINGKLSADTTGGGRLSDIVVRFLRVRPEQILTGDGSDEDAVQFNRVERCVLDHLSISWSTDENIGFYETRRATVQWCAVEEACAEGHYKGRHNYGLLCGPDGGPITVHHNLFANNSRRHPAIANGPSDVRNNVVYNFRDGFLHDNPPNKLGFNIVGNYYKKGPSSPAIHPFCFADSALYYLRDNWVDGVGRVDDPWALVDLSPSFQHYTPLGMRSRTEFTVPPVTTQGAVDAYYLVLEEAGCFPRDSLSRRTVTEVRSRGGAWGKREVGDLMAGLTVRQAPQDTDGDGMPDRWETANGLDPADGADHSRVMASSYTAIEEYCNALAARLLR
ncbi:MAG TPA: pectate lyase precursor [Candidatus Glassbacteria bacterium]|nr:pectate lyase precursor [Candidatus Glassbacteria bacterium]